MKKRDEATYLFILSGVVVVAAIFLAGWFVYGRVSISPEELSLNPEEDVEDDTLSPCVFRRRLNGICVETEREIESNLAAVMIENSRDAWPLSGLAKADVVYEVPVEGNIPRFMAIYQSGADVEKAGPVRSARPYFIDWVSEYGDMMYLHVGGSDEALEKIDTHNLFDINEFFRGRYFWRADDRSAPHNVYTSNELWDKARNDYGKFYEPRAFDSWVFGEAEPCTEDCVTDIRVAFLSPTYDARWVYASSTGQYVRYENNSPQYDADGSPILADTVIVQRAKIATIDEVGRKRIDTTGSGEALVFRDGFMVAGTWQKAGRIDRTEWYDEEEKRIALAPGKIWIEVVSPNTRVDTK